GSLTLASSIGGRPYATIAAQMPRSIARSRQRRCTTETVRPRAASVIVPQGEARVPPGDDAAPEGGEYRPHMSVHPAQTTDLDGEISIVVADDQALVRAGFSAILESQPGITVCGEAADGGEAIELVRQLDPDVV